MKNKTVLVTGGAGYIGSHTCKLLAKSGYLPVVLDNLVYGHRSFVKWGPLVEGDISDQSILSDIFIKYKPCGVIHFAAYAYVGESVINPAKYYINNVSGTLTLLEAMRASSCKNIVFSSTCATYGLPSSIPIKEEDPRVPINPYGKSKLMIEQILKDYDLAYGLKHIALRYFNAAGADIDGELGEDHIPETHLIPLAIYTLLGKTQQLEIFGTDYPTPDGTAVRDYIHVEDLAKAHLLSLEMLVAERKSDAFNLGTGLGVSVQQVIDSLRIVSGKNLFVSYGDRRAGDPPELVADPAKAKSVLGWQAHYTDLSDIMESAWKWHQKRHGMEQYSE